MFKKLIQVDVFAKLSATSCRSMTYCTNKQLPACKHQVSLDQDMTMPLLTLSAWPKDGRTWIGCPNTCLNECRCDCSSVVGGPIRADLKLIPCNETHRSTRSSSGSRQELDSTPQWLRSRTAKHTKQAQHEVLDGKAGSLFQTGAELSQCCCAKSREHSGSRSAGPQARCKKTRAPPRT